MVAGQPGASAPARRGRPEALCRRNGAGAPVFRFHGREFAYSDSRVKSFDEALDAGLPSEDGAIELLKPVLQQRMNEVYRTYFDREPLPARTTIGVNRLPGGKARIEVSVVALR